MKNRKAAEQQALAQKLTFVPVVSGSFVESATSAPGFVGHNYVWQAGVGATWQLDLTTFANVRSQDAAADAARAREQRARLFARDAIHRYWNTVHSDIAGARSARAQAKASEQASRMAQDRYEVGASTGAARRLQRRRSPDPVRCRPRQCPHSAPAGRRTRRFRRSVEVNRCRPPGVPCSKSKRGRLIAPLNLS
jgi:outer membrane protein TolC